MFSRSLSSRTRTLPRRRSARRASDTPASRSRSTSKYFDYRTNSKSSDFTLLSLDLTVHFSLQ